MVDRITGRLIVSLIFLLAISTGFAQAPSGSAKKDSSVSAQSDEELNLDEGNNTLVPASKAATNISAPVKSAVAPQTPAPAPAKQAASQKTDAATPQMVPATAAPAKSTVEQAQDEDLILDGGANNLIDPSKVAAKKAAEAKKLAADSARKTETVSKSQPGASGSVKDAANKTPISASAAADSTNKIPTPATASAPAAAEAPVVPVVVENERSINFAKNLKEYRSPKLAMLMSLILPGSGQVYAGSGLAAAGFALVEAGIMTGGLVLANKAAVAKKHAYAYADQHYDTAKFNRYYDSLKSWVNTNVKNNGAAKDSNGDVITQPVFANNYLNQTIFTSSNEVIQFRNDAHSKNDNYYTTINNGPTTPYIQGWKDASPPAESLYTDGWHVDPAAYGTGSDNSGYLLYQKSTTTSTDTAYFYGQSNYFNVYKGMMKTATDWSNKSRTVFFTLLINHIASAVIAGIQAQRHNDELLGKQSYLDHLDLQMDYVNTGSETVPAYSLAVKF